MGPPIHHNEDVLPPFVHANLVQDGYTMPAQELGVEERVPSLQVGPLNLIFMVLVEDMFLEPIQGGVLR